MSDQPRKPNAILPPPRAKKSSSQGTVAGRGSSMKERQVQAMTKLLASFGPDERAEYEKLKQLRMKKKKRR